MAGIIVSDPAIGTKRYGLTDKGTKQVRCSVNTQQVLDRATRIITSDFLRASQTADLVQRDLKAIHPVKHDRRLRERFFGRLDQGVDTAYTAVWTEDKRNPDHCYENVESVNAVLTRSVSLVNDLEGGYRGEVFLLVAHGDILQILQTAFQHCPPSRHRDLRHLETAEIRLLNADPA